MKRISIIILFLLPFALLTQAQDLYVPRNMLKAYKGQTRDANGKPGAKYWQNKPEYNIDINFNPQNSLLKGKEHIKYINNSPDTLNEITFTMLGDIYKKTNHKHDWGMDRKIMHDGIVMKKIIINGEDLDLNSKKIRRSGTNMFIKLDKKLNPQSEIQINLEWEYLMPLRAVIRAGNYGDSTYMVAYFYPKIAVYDDIDGWDKHDYTGYGEFFGEYADYDVNITVPADFKVWATGELQNPEQILSPPYLKRWQDAHKLGKSIRIIDKDETEKREVTLPGETHNWHYVAKHVPDFAFGTSNRFRWDAKTIIADKKTGRKTFICTAYAKNRKHYPRIIDLLDTVLTNYSNHIPGVPYPYPSMKIFNGNAGMEFPMMCNDAESSRWRSNVGLTYHEVGHTYFPFFVGTNERKYAWMDEGWATFFPNFYIKNHLAKDNKFDYLQSRINTYYQIAGMDIEVPEMVLVDLLRLRKPYRQASYNKSFLAYYYLYKYLGEQKFLKALRTYMNNWAGKHPIPYDFFYSMNKNSGEDLNWFWNNWFFEFGYGDQSIYIKDDKLIVKNKGKLMLPVIIKITYADGSTSDIAYNMKIWTNANNDEISVPLHRIKEIKKIELGADWIIDVDKSDNILTF